MNQSTARDHRGVVFKDAHARRELGDARHARRVSNDFSGNIHGWKQTSGNVDDGDSRGIDSLPIVVFVSGVQYTTSGTDMRSADDKTKFSASAAPRDNETTLASLSYEANPERAVASVVHGEKHARGVLDVRRPRVVVGHGRTSGGAK